MLPRTTPGSHHHGKSSGNPGEGGRFCDKDGRASPVCCQQRGDSDRHGLSHKTRCMAPKAKQQPRLTSDLHMHAYIYICIQTYTRAQIEGHGKGGDEGDGKDEEEGDERERENSSEKPRSMAPSDHLGIKALCRAIPEPLVAVRGHQGLGPAAQSQILHTSCGSSPP